MNTQEITWIKLILGSLTLALPVLILQYYRTGLVKASLISFGRMIVQLIFVGLYLKYIFLLNSIWLNLLWLCIMIIAAGMIIVKRSELVRKKFFVPVLLGISADVLINGAIFAFVILGSGTFLDARYLIPIMGMVIGNCISSSIIGIRSLYNGLRKDLDRYNYYLACGATRNEALFPYISSAMKESFSPVIASTATIGLIWLPGMMTGQIIGGSEPIQAIKYQILIIIAIFVGSVATVTVSIISSKKYAFDDTDLFDKSIHTN